MKLHASSSSLIARAAGILIAGANVSSAATFQNGDFETPNIGNTFFIDYGTGSTAITGWTVVGTAGLNVAIIGQGAAANYDPEHGVQWIDLTGTSQTFGEGLSQTFDTIAGDQYSVSFWVGNAITDGSVTSTVNVEVNGGLPTPYLNANFDSSNGANVVWENFVFDFVASGSSSSLAFLNGDPGNDSLNGLDNIALTDLGPTATTPLPAGLPLFASGLAGLGLLGLRRKRITRAVA